MSDSSPAVVELDELPIGAGRGAPGTGAAAAEPLERPLGPIAPTPPQALLEPAAPLVIVEWQSAKLKRPLQVFVGKPVNQLVRHRYQLETKAGLMSDEHADAIADPLAEILNRYDPTRALAARQVEFALAAAIYDYVHETTVEAGRDLYRARQELEQARDQRAESGLSTVRPPIAHQGDVPEL